MDLHGKQWLTLGNNDSGKTNFNKWILSERPQHMVFDPMDEFKHKWGYNQYVPEARRGDEAQEELGDFIDDLVKPSRQTLNYIFIDEINRYHTKGGKLTGPLGELVDTGNSHWDMGVGMAARKPQQVHTDIRDLSDVLFIFYLDSPRALQLLDKEVKSGISEKVSQLNPYECVMVHNQQGSKEIKVLSPAPYMKEQKKQ